MAYINGNKPIVTDGLIYALDFGNSRCYTSGSTQATSLAYDRATTLISGSPTFNNDLLDFTSTKFIKRDGSLPALDPNGTFTVMFVGNSTGIGTFLRQDTLNSTINPTSSLFGFGLDSGDFSRSYPGFTSSSLQHVTYRYSEGTIDTFINGIPVTASVANASLTNTAVSNALFIGSGSAGFSGSLAQFYVYNRALSADEIYTTYLVSAERNGLPTVPKPYTQDENVYKYVQTTGITDLDTISAIDTFVSNLKSNGLWNKMTAIYPFLTTSTGSQAINLKDPGVLGLGLTGSFSASAVGLTPASSTAYVDTLPSNIPYPSIDSSSAHLSLLSYGVPQTSSYLAGNFGTAGATGGNTFVANGRIYHVFTTGSSTFTPIHPSINAVEVLVVAGGGAGGSSGVGGGGGGAGGLVYSSSFSVTPSTSYTAVVGEPGTGSAAISGSNGQNSQFGTIIAIGGGGGAGGSTLAGTSGSSGGSGGGGTGRGSLGVIGIGGLGTAGQGSNGGNGTTGGDGGGGGGGAGTSGSNALTPGGGNGGSGSFFPQFVNTGYGSPSGWFAGGGGGGTGGGPGGSGGIGGGGSGGDVTTPNGTAGVTNTGGGGGGNRGGGAGGRNGGSGIIIVSYPAIPGGPGTGIFITDSSVTGSLNSEFSGGITGSGNIGFLTVSRTGSGLFSLHKNNISQSINLPASNSLSLDNYLGGANLAGGTSSFGNSNTSISYASIGAGLTDSEVSTYYNLVSQFQTNLKRQNTLLDNYSGAAAAYSLRRIGPSGYFGPAIRVRRDSDNTLRDIGFTSDGQLDTVGLLDFVGVTGSGFVQTWYDQSGNSNNAAQVTTGSQPRVVRNGIIPYTSVYPSVEFIIESSSFMQLTNTFSGTAGSRFFISKLKRIPTVQTETAYPFDDVGSSNQSSYYPNTNALLADDFASTTVKDPAGNSPGLGLLQPHLHSTISIPNFWTNYHNSNQLFNTTTNTVGFNTTPSLIGKGLGYSTSYLNGYISEILFYASDQTTNRTAIESNINNNYKIFGSATASFDPDYQSFITATGITQPTQSAALETLVSDLKSYGLWNKMKAIYPMVTDRNNRFAQSEAFNSTWNAQSASVSPNQIAAPDGTTTGDLILDIIPPGPTQTFTVTVENDGVGNVFVLNGTQKPTLTLVRGGVYTFDQSNGTNNNHPIAFKSGSESYTAGVVSTGTPGTAGAQTVFTVASNAPSNLSYYCTVHGDYMGNTITVTDNSSQHYIYQTIDGATGIVTGSEYVLSTYAKFYNTPYIAFKTNVGAQAWFDVQTGATGSYTGSNATITDEGNGWYRCALYFTSSETTGPYNQQIHLARTDNDLTFAGTGTSGSYLWGAQFENGNLLGPYRKTEGSGFVVSGSDSMLDQMKYNLKDSRDTDDGFRLVYSGSWNPGYGSNKPDGAATTYAKTSMPFSTLNNSSYHYGFYSTTNAINNFEYTVVGVDGGGNRFNLYNQDRYYANSGGDITVVVGSFKAFHLLNRPSSTFFNAFRNTTKVGTSVSSPPGSTSSEILISNNGSFSFGPSPLGCGLVTIGDGLTDYEAKALYWIVQKFQTTLGRQVY
jgi:hypothetical protein